MSLSFVEPDRKNLEVKRHTRLVCEGTVLPDGTFVVGIPADSVPGSTKVELVYNAVNTNAEATFAVMPEDLDPALRDEKYRKIIVGQLNDEYVPANPDCIDGYNPGFDRFYRSTSIYPHPTEFSTRISARYMCRTGKNPIFANYETECHEPEFIDRVLTSLSAECAHLVMFVKDLIKKYPPPRKVVGVSV